MTITQLQELILKEKARRDICILAHSYQTPDICEVADRVGDSFQLSVAATKLSQKKVVLCGVHFMAETVKLLSPEKEVVLPAEAGCPMAEQFAPEEIRAFRESHPGVPVVCYVNTTAALKAECDVCVTSSSAVRIVRALPQKELLFIPDCNLGRYVQQQVPDKTVHLWKGGCPLHGRMTEQDVLAAKAAHPGAKLLMHPECSPSALACADYIGSTADIMNFAAADDGKEYIIGTDHTIAAHLALAHPEKRFYPLSKELFCPDMKRINLMDVYLAVTGQAGIEITMEPSLTEAALRPIRAMLELG
ncbi:MAG: quinolinate synthase NadA [Ruminococcaceae bacterium]|nr:quinolinate synthase NadA [Oscillospiraceae bacterium]